MVETIGTLPSRSVSNAAALLASRDRAPCRQRHLPVHGRGGIDATGQAVARRLRGRPGRAPAPRARRVLAARRHGGRHAGRLVLLRLLSRPRRRARGGGCAAGAAGAPVARGLPKCACGWASTPASPWSRRTAITGSACTARRASWPRATAGRSWPRRRRRPCSTTTTCPAWSRATWARSGSRTSTAPSASTSSTSRDCRPRFRRSAPARRSRPKSPPLFAGRSPAGRSPSVSSRACWLRPSPFRSSRSGEARTTARPGSQRVQDNAVGIVDVKVARDRRRGARDPLAATRRGRSGRHLGHERRRAPSCASTPRATTSPTRSRSETGR